MAMRSLLTGGAVGLLLFAQGPDSKQHVGSFANPATGFKFIDSICQAEGIASNQGTISHSNGNSKGAATFLWNPGRAPVANVDSHGSQKRLAKHLH